MKYVILIALLFVLAGCGEAVKIRKEQQEQELKVACIHKHGSPIIIFAPGTGEPVFGGCNYIENKFQLDLNKKEEQQ